MWYFIGALVIFFGFSLKAGSCASAAEYRRLADQAVQSRQFAQAAGYYRQEAMVYRRIGEINAAVVEEAKAARWSTEIHLFADQSPQRQSLMALYTGGKFEPVYGCYLGAYVVGDDRLEDGGEGLWSVRYANRARSLGDLIHRRLATSWDYCNYGSPFPMNWARPLCADGIAPHIAWQPLHGLDEVQDDDYLEQFAQDARSCNGPIFLRFAAEMNGNWTPWHGNPALYRQKFRLVHDVMARLAPNVAMIWCVNQNPEYNIDQYYPGDQYVDWVGINFYSVIHHNNDPRYPGTAENPASLLEYVYQKYAARKPIAICEYGASHQEKLDPGMDYAPIASGKLAELFAALPRQFPRVKLIGIFDCNNLTCRYVARGRDLNNYCVTDNLTMLASLRRAVASDYFLPSVVQSDQEDFPAYTCPLSPGMALSEEVRLSAWVKTYEERPTVAYFLDGKLLARLSSAGEYNLDLDTTRISRGKHLLSLVVLDSRGMEAGRQEVPVLFTASQNSSRIQEDGAAIHEAPVSRRQPID